MRIHDLVIDNFRAIEHLELRDLPDTGVIVIHGQNEAGKSTILDAIGTVLQERHSAGGKKIKVFAPVGRDASPEVTMTATVGETTFRIHKRWLKGKLSELEILSPVHKNFTGRQADDELARIIAEQMDTSLAKTLFLRQGELDPGIAAAGIPSISQALDAENGTERSGEEDTELMAAIEAEYARYWTAATPPKPKASFTAKSDVVDTARETLRAAEAEVQQLATFVDEVARREEEIRAVDTELPQAHEELAGREAEFAQASQLAEKAKSATEQLERATVARKRAEQDLAERTALTERVAKLREEEKDLQAALAPAQEARDAEREKVAELTAQVEEAKTRLATVRTTLRGAENVRDHVRASRRLTVVTDQLTLISKADEAYATLLKNAPALQVTDADVRKLEKAESELTLQRRLREAASAKLEITAEDKTIQVDGESMGVDGTESVAVYEGTRLTLDDFDVVFRAAQGSEDPRRAVEKAEDALSSLLSKLGCADVDEARAARDASKAHEAEVKSARQRRDDALAGTDADELAAERDRLTSQLEELAEAIDTAELPDTEQAAELAVKDAQKALDKAEKDVDAADAALKPYADRTAASELTVVQTKLEAKQAEASHAADELAHAEDNAPKTTLESALESASEQEREANEAHAVLSAELAAADPEIAQQMLEGAKARRQNLEKRQAEAKNRITELTGRIEIAAGAAEKADRAAAELDAAETELARTTRRADAVRLLRETMHTHRDAARARYTAPFNDAIRNHARVLFGPTVDFNFGDDLTVTERTVDGVSVPLDQLSGGTKEQLAILTRFAIADLVTASGETTPVPVVVDDALGATDPERLARMNSLFSQVGKTSQVLVLTCFPQRFDRVAAARTYSMDELKSAPMD